MSRWNSVFGLRRQQPKTRRSKAPVKPRLERLEERTLLSASPMQAEASEAINQWDYLLTLVQQNVNNYIQTLDREIAQVVSDLGRLLESRFGTPNASPPPAPAAPPANNTTGGNAVLGGNGSTPISFKPPTISIKPPPNLIIHPRVSGGGTPGSSGGGTGGTLIGTSGTSGGGGGLIGSGSGGGIYVNGAGIPAGLLDVSPLSSLSNSPPIPYTETHTINRSESNTVTIDQAGGGVAGTFTVTVTGNSNASDNATGSASGFLDMYNVTETPGGNATASDNYKLVLSGSYSNGTFTVTGGTGTETGSYNSSQNNTTTTTSPTTGSTTSDEWDSTNSDNFTVSMGLGLNSSGQLVFTSYTLTETATAYYHTHVAAADGSYDDDSYTATTPMNTSGSGLSASYSANETLDAKWDHYEPGGSGNSSGENDQTNPVSGTVDLSGLLPQTSGWQWFAGAPNAQNYTFHAVFSENATLGETATLQPGSNGGGPTIKVNSFNSSFQGTVSAHTVDDEPEMPASSGGTDSFHRDETYGGSDTVTGSGSYGGSGGGSTNATFQAVQVGQYNVADTESDNNETISGTDANGNPYTLAYNYSGQLQGSGSFQATHNYQDVGNGPALTSETFQSGGSGTNSYQYSGTYNGQAFDDPSTVPEGWTAAPATFPGDPTPVATPDGLVHAFPPLDTITPNGAVYMAPAAWPGVFLQVDAAKVVAKAVQLWYNSKAKGAEAQAKNKALVTIAKKELVEQLTAKPKISGTFTFSSGNSWADAAGDAKDLAKAQENNLNIARRAKNVNNPTVGQTVVSITYAVDGGALKPRSGNAILAYKYVTTYNGTNAQGQPISVDLVVLGGKAVRVHDAKIETMTLTEE